METGHITIGVSRGRWLDNEVNIRPPSHWRGSGHPLRWRHNGPDCVSNHQPHDCLLNRLFQHRSKKTSKLRVTGLCAGNSPGTGEFPAPGTGEFPAQRASYVENVSIWWRHHATRHLDWPWRTKFFHVSSWLWNRGASSISYKPWNSNAAIQHFIFLWIKILFITKQFYMGLTWIYVFFCYKNLTSSTIC